MFTILPSRALLSSSRLAATRHPIIPRINSTRQLQSTSRSLWPRKDSQDKDSINRESTEYSKSSTDDRTAEQDEAAFDPNITRPESEHAKAGEGLHGETQGQPNPLDVSPANPEVSKPRRGEEGGPEHAAGEQRTGSGHGSGKKGTAIR